MPNFCGIYRISSPSGNCYIGSSVHVFRRWRQHKSELRRGKHHSAALQAACAKHGLESLTFTWIVGVPDRAHLLAVEQAVMDEIRPQYNASSVAACPCQDPTVAAKLSASILASASHAVARAANQKKASAALSKPVTRLTDGVAFPSGYEAARAHGIKHADNLSTAIKNGWRFAGHYWAFVGHDVTLKQLVAKAQDTNLVRKARATAASVASRSRAVRRINDGAQFPSLSAAARACGVNLNTIYRAAKMGMRADGSRWEYVTP